MLPLAFKQSGLRSVAAWLVLCLVAGCETEVSQPAPVALTPSPTPLSIQWGKVAVQEGAVFAAGSQQTVHLSGKWLNKPNPSDKQPVTAMVGLKILAKSKKSGGDLTMVNFEPNHRDFRWNGNQFEGTGTITLPKQPYKYKVRVTLLAVFEDREDIEEVIREFTIDVR